MQALEQEKEYLTAENEGLTAQIAEARADIQLLKDAPLEMSQRTGNGR